MKVFCRKKVKKKLLIVVFSFIEYVAPFKVQWFSPDITAGITKMCNQVRHQKMLTPLAAFKPLNTSKYFMAVKSCWK